MIRGATLRMLLQVGRLMTMETTCDKLGSAARRWWLSAAAWFILTVAGVVLGDSQGGGASTSVSFLQNYASASDAQHFRVLNNGQQVQLVLDEYSGCQVLPNLSQF